MFDKVAFHLRDGIERRAPVEHNHFVIVAGVAVGESGVRIVGDTDLESAHEVLACVGAEPAAQSAGDLWRPTRNEVQMHGVIDHKKSSFGTLLGGRRSSIVYYYIHHGKEFDVTLRDDKKGNRARLDTVRNSRGADRLSRPIDLVRKWSFVTDVRLQRAELVWKHAERIRAGDHWLLDGAVARQAIVTRSKAEQEGRGILDEFLFLSDAPNESILQYARTWGVLELCRHNLPAGHEFSLDSHLRLPLLLKVPKAWHTELPANPRQCRSLGREPLATWRFFSRQAKALLNIAADLQRGRLGQREDWAAILRNGVTPVQSLDTHRSCTRDVLEDWLSLGRIKPAIDDRTGALTWTGADLFGELAVQIALAAKALDGQVFCIVCGKPYEPKRRVIRRGFNYCPAEKCQRRAAAERAQRYRNKKAEPGARVRVGKKLPFRGVYGGTTNDPLFSQ